MQELYHRRTGLSSATFTPGRGFWYNIPAMASHIPPKNMLFACFSADPEDASAPEMPASFLPDRESPALCQYDVAELVESYARRLVLPLFPVSPQEALRRYNEDGRRIVPSVPHLLASAGQRPSMSVEGSTYDEALVELVSYLVNLACTDVRSAKAAANWAGWKPDGYLGNDNPTTWFADPGIWSALGSDRRGTAEESLAVTRHFPRKTAESWGKFTLHVNRASRQGKVPEHGMDFPLLADRVVDTETATVNLGPGLGSVRLPKDSLVWAYDEAGSRFDDDGHLMLQDSFRGTEGPESDKSNYDQGRRIDGGAYLPLAAHLKGAYLPAEAHYDPDLRSGERRYYAEIGPAAYESVPVSPGSAQYMVPESAGLPYAYSSLPPRSVGLGPDHVVAYGGHDWRSYYGYTYVVPRPWGPAAKSYWDANPGLKDTSGLTQAVAHLWREPLPLGAYPNTATGARYDVARTPVLLTPALLTRADARLDPSKSYVDAFTQTPGNPVSLDRREASGTIAWFPDSLGPRTLLDELYRWRDEHLRATVTLVDMAVAESAAFDRRSAYAQSTATDDHVRSSGSGSESHYRSGSGRKDVETLEAEDFAVTPRGRSSQTGSPYDAGDGGSIRLDDLLRAPLLKEYMAADGTRTYTSADGGLVQTRSERTRLEATAHEETRAPRLKGLTPVRRETVASGGLGGGTMRFASGTSRGSVDKSWYDGSGEEPDMSAGGMTADPETTYVEKTCGRHLPLIPDWMAPAVLRAALYVAVRAETRRAANQSWSRFEAGSYGEGASGMLQKDVGDDATAASAKTTVLKLSEYDPGTGKFAGEVTAADADALYPPLPEQVWAGATPAAAKGWIRAGDGMRTLASEGHRYMYDGTYGYTRASSGAQGSFSGSYVTGSARTSEDPYIMDSSYMVLVVEWDFDTPLPLDGSPASCMEYLLDARRRVRQALEALEAAEERKDETEALFDEANTSTDFTYVRDQEDLDELESSRRVRVIWSDDAPFADSGAAKAWAALQEAAGPEATEGLGAGIDALRERLEADSGEIENTVAELEEEMEDPEYEDDPSRCRPLWARAGTDLADARKLKADAVRMLRDAKREDGVLRAESAAIVSRYDSLRSSGHPDEWRPYANGRPVWMYDASKDVQFAILGTMESLFGRTGDTRQVAGASGAYWVVMSHGVAMYLPAYSDASALPSPEMADVPLVLLGQLG